MKSQSAFPRYAAMQMLDALGGRELFLLCGISNVQLQGSSGIGFTLPDFLAQRQINRVSVSRVGGKYLIVFSRKNKVSGRYNETTIAAWKCEQLSDLAESFRFVTGLATGVLG